MDDSMCCQITFDFILGTYMHIATYSKNAVVNENARESIFSSVQYSPMGGK